MYHLVLKMNTGSGKTLVGLLLLKSCLNENLGPALYVAPDSYLVKQVIKEAEEMGISITENPQDLSYLKGDSICVINIYKLINGRSVFGVGEQGTKIEIKSVIIDDAHACLSALEGQFTLTLDASSQAYKELFELFRENLRQQSETGFLEIKDQDPTRNMLLPYWAWIDKNAEVAKILHCCKDEEKVKFIWPLIKENLHLCRCVFGGGEVEISPRCLPIDAIPSFVKAVRRVFMSATLSDDSILITNFDIDPESIRKPIVPKNANDIGDRMILIPQEINPDITKENIKQFLFALSDKYNIIIIVPSNAKAKLWEDIANETLRANNLHEGIQKLKSQHIGLVVLVNKYDGIDLPFDACRILVIDGIPDVRRRIDKIEQSILQDSEFTLTREIQRIEQGMGRGIRATNDYCVVFLMDSNLVRRLYSKNARDKFSAATRAQLELSSKVAQQMKGKSINDFEETINYCLQRNPEWLKASKGALVDLRYEEKGNVDEVALKQREAFEAAKARQFDKAVETIQQEVNIIDDNILRGWLMQELAEYTHHSSPTKSQEILKSAITFNPRLLKPLDGIVYRKLSGEKINQAKNCSVYVSKLSNDSNEFIIYLNAIADDLHFSPDTSEHFEEAVKKLADIIGFEGQRPEAETGKGPDVFWKTDEKTFFVIECKNGAKGQIISKGDCDQLSGSMNWFKEKYSTACVGVPIIIHPSNKIDRKASPYSEMRVIDSEKLDALRTALIKFGKALIESRNLGKYDEIRKLLSHYSLTPKSFLKNYTTKYRVA